MNLNDVCPINRAADKNALRKMKPILKEILKRIGIDVNKITKLTNREAIGATIHKCRIATIEVALTSENIFYYINTTFRIGHYVHKFNEICHILPLADPEALTIQNLELGVSKCMQHLINHCIVEDPGNRKWDRTQRRFVLHRDDRWDAEFNINAKLKNKDTSSNQEGEINA